MEGLNERFLLLDSTVFQIEQVDVEPHEQVVDVEASSTLALSRGPI